MHKKLQPDNWNTNVAFYGWSCPQQSKPDLSIAAMAIFTHCLPWMSLEFIHISFILVRIIDCTPSAWGSFSRLYGVLNHLLTCANDVPEYSHLSANHPFLLVGLSSLYTRRRTTCALWWKWMALEMQLIGLSIMPITWPFTSCTLRFSW